MKVFSTAMAALALLAMTTLGPATEARADGRGVAAGVGVYLVADAVVGHGCGGGHWPFNIFGRIVDGFHGDRGCGCRRTYHRHYRRHHHRHCYHRHYRRSCHHRHY